MYTAKEIGGDFYDFFWLDRNRIVLVIADVSGKGLPAALGMMNAKTLIKELLMSILDLQKAVKIANREFCTSNKLQMFLTAFIAVIDLKKQTISCINAGHNPQLIKPRGEPWKYLKLPSAIPFAVKPEYPFTSIEMPFRPGDRIFLYTDGITEAHNPDQKMFGTQRLLNVLNENDCTPDEALKKIKTNVDMFANGEPQSDDITMLACEFRIPDDKNVN